MRDEHGSNVPASGDAGDGPLERSERLAGSDFTPPDPPESSGFEWERYVSAIRRYKWSILLVTLLGTAAGVAVAHWMQPQYLAQATLWIEWRDQRGSGGSSDLGPIQSDELLQSYNWLELLKSYAVLEPVVREEGLFVEPASEEDTAALASLDVDPEYTPGEFRVTVDQSGEEYALWSADSTVIERGAPGDSIGTSLGLRWAPGTEPLRASSPVEFRLMHTRDAARQLRENLETFMLERGNFLRLELEGSDPDRAAAVLGGIADRFITLAGELKRTKVDELTRMLEGQLESAGQQLADAEEELEAFRVQNAENPSRGVSAAAPGDGEDAGGGGTVAERYQGLGYEIQELERQRRRLNTALEGGAGSDAEIDMLTTIPAVQRSSALRSTLDQLSQKRADLRALRQLYTEQHQDVQRLRSEIDQLQSQTIPELARNLEQQLASRQSELEQERERLASELREMPPRETQEGQLQRRVEISQELYTTLKSRYEEARLAAASTLPDVQVLDEPEVGRLPISDERPQVIALAFAGSLGLALLGALLVDRLDTRVRYPEEVSEGMGLRILATIPHLQAKKGLLGVQDAGAATEAFRTLRLNVSHAHGSAGPLMATVSSPSPGDGKSFVSVNLALTYARLGRRTLLIDGDIRRGRLYRLLEGRRKPGLTDYLSNGKSEDAVIQETSYESLDFLSTGRGMQAGPELLQSSRMQDLMMKIRSDYEAVIVDSPPLGAGIDPLVLSTFTGNLLLVLRAGTTKRALAQAKLDLMTPLPIRVLGAVLNDVGQQESYYKYYGTYTPGYEVRNQDVQEVSTRLLEP